MAFCRWSSERFQCDLYCYEDSSGGFTTHVAGRRRKPAPDDLIDPMSLDGLQLIKTDPEAWMKVNEAWGNWLAEGREFDDAYVDIDSPHVGKTYNDPTIEEFRERIAELSSDPGLCVPKWLLPSIDEEIALGLAKDDAVG